MDGQIKRDEGTGHVERAGKIKNLYRGFVGNYLEDLDIDGRCNIKIYLRT
jgi:hypothetical protein